MTDDGWPDPGLPWEEIIRINPGIITATLNEDLRALIAQRSEAGSSPQPDPWRVIVEGAQALLIYSIATKTSGTEKQRALEKAHIALTRVGEAIKAQITSKE